jgi:hypothetical protein
MYDGIVIFDHKLKKWDHFYSRESFLPNFQAPYTTLSYRTIHHAIVPYQNRPIIILKITAPLKRN